MNRKSTFLMSLVLLWILAGGSLAWGAAGDLSWQKSFNYLPEYDMVFPSVTSSSAFCVVSGQAQKSDYSTAPLGFIKVLDMATGDLKWERTLNLGASDNYFSNIIIDGNVVYLQSYSSSYTNGYDSDTHTTVRIYGLNLTVFGAYDANTGNPIWEKTKDNFSGYLSADPVTPQAINRLVLIGSENPSGFGPSGDCIVSVYQAKNSDLFCRHPPAFNPHNG